MATPSPEEMKQRQKAGWDFATKKYGEMLDATKYGREAFVMMVDAIKAKHGDAPFRLLDVAASVGEPGVTIGAALPAASIVSTDIAPSAAELGPIFAKARGVTNITYEVADAENLSYPDASFDVVTCAMGLMFMPTHTKALVEFRRVLKPGGLLFVLVWSADVPMFQVVSKAAAAFGMPSISAFSPCKFGDGLALIADIEAAGFRSTEHKALTVDMRFSPTMKYIFMEGTPMGAGLDARRKAGEEDVLERFKAVLDSTYEAEGVVQADGGIAFPGNKFNYISALAV